VVQKLLILNPNPNPIYLLVFPMCVDLIGGPLSNAKHPYH
jgi:hypothetical protein